MSATYKLVSSKGTLLGTITIPHHWAEIVRERRFARFNYIPNLRPLFSRPPDETNVEMNFVCRTIAIAESWHPEHRGAVELHGATLEEFEAIPGCSFAPGAAYLRSLIEGA